MSMTVGELVATFDVDASGAVTGITQAEAAVAGLQRNVDGTWRDMSGNAVRSGAEIGQALGNGIRVSLDEAIGEMHPQFAVDGDTNPADAEVRALVQRISRLSATIDVNAPVGTVSAELDTIRAELQSLATNHPNITVGANATTALAGLETVRQAVDSLNGRHPQVAVQTNAPAAVAALTAVRLAADRTGASGGPGRLASMLSSVGNSLGSVAADAASTGAQFAAMSGPVSSLVATLVNIVPAAAIATTALLAVAQAAAVIKIGTSGIGSALKAAFAPAQGGGGGAASGASQVANSLQAVRDATVQAAAANHSAEEQVATDERAVTTAQQAAKQAQLDLTAARQQAARDLQDMNNQLTDSVLSQRQATLNLQEAQEQLAQVKATGADADSQQMQEAQLAADQAAQQVKEATLAQQRQTTDTAAANKAGVSGSKGVVDAQAQVVKSQQDIRDSVQQLADAQASMARTAAQGLEAIQKAQQAANTSTAAGAGGVDAYAAAMAKLAPNAQAFVRQVVALGPAWTALKLDVQQRLFAGLATSLKSTASSVLPTLRKELVSSAGALNDMAKGVLSSAKGLADSGVLGTAMHAASTGLHNLSGIPGLVVTAFGQLAAAAGPEFDKITASVGRAAGQIGKALTGAFKDGSLTKAIDDAVQLIGEIITVGKNVGGILMSVFKATSSSGGSFLDVLKTISGALNKAFASPAVQSALKALFGVINDLATTAAPLLMQALGVIAPVLTALGPPAKVLISSLGKMLSPIIKALGPILLAAAGAVGALVTGLAPLLPVIGQVIAGFGPALTPIIKGVTTILQQMAPIVVSLAAALMGMLGPILAQLPTIMTPLVSIITTLTGALLPILTQLITALAPSMATLGKSFGQILVALAPVITQWGVLITDCLQVITPMLPPIIKLIGQLATLMTGQLARQITLVVVPALKLMADVMSGHFKDAGADAKKLMNGIITVVKSIPGVALKALGDIGTALYGAGKGLIEGFLSGIVSKITNVKTTLSDLTNDIPSWKGPASLDAKLLTGNGQLIMGSLIGGIASKVPALHAQLTGITGSIGGMAPGLGALSAGRSGSSMAAAPASSAPIYLTVTLAGTQLGRALVDPIRKTVQDIGGGSVQVAFGTGRR